MAEGDEKKPSPPVPMRSKPIPLSGWITLIQFFSFLVNAGLNWIVVWFFFAPEAAGELSEGNAVNALAAASEATTFWTANWFWITGILSLMLQVIFVYMPMFIMPDNKIYGPWRDRLQRADDAMNFIAYTILFVYIMEVAIDLRVLLDTTRMLLEQFIQALADGINLNTIVAVAIIWILSVATSKLSLIATLIPKKTQPQQGGGGGGGGGQQQKKG